MTAKEKAEELVDKMELNFIYFASREIAKQHALIAVDEALQRSITNCCEHQNRTYWENVKQEIEKL